MGGPTSQAPSLRLTHVLDNYVAARCGEVALFRYVYRPVVAPVESPKPYFHPLRTLAGNTVTLYRPHDHVWHTGLAMTMAVLSGQNFWGGPSYVHGTGYVQLPNNGRIEHEAWHDMTCAGGRARLDEDLRWLSAAGQPWLAEQRTIEVDELDAAAGHWRLRFETRLRNVRAEPLIFSSPTVEGRPLAGYGGLFWRGPRSFLRGVVLAGGGLEGSEVMGRAAPWLAYVGRHDGSGDTSTVLFLDDPQNPRYPTKWFVRHDPYACASFAFTFDEAYRLDPGATLHLRYRIVLAGGAWPRERIEAYTRAARG